MKKSRKKENRQEPIKSRADRIWHIFFTSVWVGGAVVVGLLTIWVLVYFGVVVQSRKGMSAAENHQAALALPAAESDAQNTIEQLGFDTKKAMNTSDVAICTYSDADPQELFGSGYFNHECDYRKTAFFQLSGNTQQSIASFELSHPLDSLKAEYFLNSDNVPPCTYIFGGTNVKQNIGQSVGVEYCPKGTPATTIYNEYTGVGDVGGDYELASNEDQYIQPTMGSIPGRVLFKNYYDLNKDIQTANSQSSGGFVLVGVTEQYYFKNGNL